MFLYKRGDILEEPLGSNRKGKDSGVLWDSIVVISGIVQQNFRQRVNRGNNETLVEFHCDKEDKVDSGTWILSQTVCRLLDYFLSSVWLSDVFGG